MNIALLEGGLSFQSTRPHGARRPMPALSGLFVESFNPRARTGRDQRIRSQAARGCCFNPRARTGRDHCCGLALVDGVVSIHAPARGATRPAKPSPTSWAFQSTRPHGARPVCNVFVHAIDRVSIHAPARGATASSCATSRVGRSFNPRARTWRDEGAMGWFKIFDKFQSTRPHGARHQGRRASGPRFGFNPRARTGRDLHLQPDVPPALGFNPRARTGRDGRRRARAWWAGRFNPRARTGRDIRSLMLPARLDCFNPRARTGRDALRGHGRHRWLVSIHAPARGATSDRRGAVQAAPCFNPRARTGRDQAHPRAGDHRHCFNPRARTGRDGTVEAVHA